jgi:ABC-type phosphate/phosphonate transport system substrate-binding protein
VSGGPGPWRLALPMYNLTPELGLAWESLLLAVMDGLRRRGWSAPMQVAPPPDDLFDLWRAKDLLLSQTCGYPLVTALADDVQVLAAPAFDLPGCEGASYCSFIVVPQDGARDLEALRGKVAAINQADSQSGMNALRHTLAPLARAGRFLARVETSGSHLASLALLQSGRADVAAIDCATFGLAQRHAPDRVAGLRVLRKTVAAPALPLVASRALSAPQVQDLRAVLYELPTKDPRLLQALSVREFRPMGLNDYQPIADQIRFAHALAYPVLA